MRPVWLRQEVSTRTLTGVRVEHNLASQPLRASQLLLRAHPHPRPRVPCSTVGRAVAALAGCDFLDADDLHPRSNVDKMRAGVPLTDGDRAPWLAALRTRIQEHESRWVNGAAGRWQWCLFCKASGRRPGYSSSQPCNHLQKLREATAGAAPLHHSTPAVAAGSCSPAPHSRPLTGSSWSATAMRCQAQTAAKQAAAPNLGRPSKRPRRQAAPRREAAAASLS